MQLRYTITSLTVTSAEYRPKIKKYINKNKYICTYKIVLMPIIFVLIKTAHHLTCVVVTQLAHITPLLSLLLPPIIPTSSHPVRVPFPPSLLSLLLFRSLWLRCSPYPSSVLNKSTLRQLNHKAAHGGWTKEGVGGIAMGEISVSKAVLYLCLHLIYLLSSFTNADKDRHWIVRHSTLNPLKEIKH